MMVHSAVKETCLESVSFMSLCMCFLYTNPLSPGFLFAYLGGWVYSCVLHWNISTFLSLSFSFVFRFSVSLETSTTLLPPSLPFHMLEPVRHYVASMDRWALKGKGLPNAQFMLTMQAIKDCQNVNVKVKKVQGLREYCEVLKSCREYHEGPQY